MDSAFPGRLTINAWIVEKLAYNAKYFGFDPAENYPEISTPSEWVLGVSAGDFTTAEGTH